MGAPSQKKGSNYKGLRWLLLVLSMFGAFGFEYCYDIPSATKDLIQRHFNQVYSEDQFEILYSVLYSIMAFPNIILPLVLGILIDKFGVRINFMFMAIGIALGAVVIYSGVAGISFPVLIVGRVVVGAFGESIHIVEGLFLRDYFSSNQMSFVIALIECSLHTGGIVNAWLSPRLAVNKVSNAFGAAVILCVLTAIMIFAACIIDKWVEKQTLPGEAEDQQEEGVNETEEAEELDYQEVEDAEPLLDLDIMEGEENLEEPVEVQPQPQVQESFWHRLKAYLANINKFPSIYWFVALAGALTLPSILSFTMISTSYITDKEYSDLSIEDATVQSAEISSLFRITAAVSSPFLGYIIDKVGKRARFLCSGVILALASHILMIFFNPAVCCILYGLAYALIATTMWPSVYTIIEKGFLGIATGIVNAIDNTGLLIFPLIVGLIKTKSGSYDYSQIFLACLTIISTISALNVIYLLKQRHRRPNIPRLTPQVTANVEQILH